MTKYLLHGGITRDVNSENEGFFSEMVTELSRGRVLLVYFAREENEVEDCRREDVARFLQFDKELEFEVATEENLEEQIKSADVIYLRGGKTEWLVEKMGKVSSLKELFEGKVVGGFSAGVYVLAKYYFENDTEELGEGLGILNIKAFCHYSPDRKDILDKLISFKENLPVLTLPNYKWVTIYK